METVKITDARTHLSRLVERAAQGETIVIAKRGVPIARLMPLEQPRADASRRLGFLKGKLKVPDDFDRMFEDEIADIFYGPDE